VSADDFGEKAGAWIGFRLLFCIFKEGAMSGTEIVPGLVGEVKTVVGEEDTARHLGSGNVNVFATPVMIRLMERAGVAAVDHLLPEGQRTVGVHVDVKHLAATPLGLTVRARAELLEVEGHKLTFKVEAFDDQEKVGEGTHRRVIIDLEEFKERVEKKGRGGA
jgi:fluoroacetyl-CoA thioesterase